MNTQTDNDTALDAIPATEHMVEALFSQTLISADAKAYALQRLHPSHHWGRWLAQWLLVLGIALVIAGIIYFFASYWTEIPLGIKLRAILVIIFSCFGAAYFLGLQNLSGKMLLLAASALVGVFLSILNHLYHIDTNPYILPMLWAILIWPWVMLSRFAVLWLVWLIISSYALDLGLDLFLSQFMPTPTPSSHALINSFLVLFNGLFLILREYFSAKGVSWLQDAWTRIILVIAILFYALSSPINLIIGPEHATLSLGLASLLSVAINIIFFIVYRYKRPDMCGLTATILSGCIILETALFKALTKLWPHNEAMHYLLIGAITVILFTLAIRFLTKLTLKPKKVVENTEHKRSLNVSKLKFISNGFQTHLTTARELLNSWLQQGLIAPSERTSLENFIVSQQQAKALPLYLHVLVGLGTFIAAFCFIVFFNASKLINLNSSSNLVIWGLLFVGLAFLTKAAANKTINIKQAFLIQSSFCSMLIGKVFFVLGFAGSGGRGWSISLALLLITAITYPFYRIPSDRFLSTLALFISILLNVFGAPYFDITTAIALNAFFFSLIILTAIFLMPNNLQQNYRPLAYAAVISLCLAVLYSAAQSKIGYWGSARAYSLVFINATLTLALLGLIGWVANNFPKLKTEPLLIASFGATLLGIFSAPGIILALCLMILSYAKHEKSLSWISIVLMPIFIALYYSNLDLSLSTKSAILIGSGIVLLAGRGYLAIRKLDEAV